MASVGTPVVRRIVEVGLAPERTEDLLASVGLAPGTDGSVWAGESVDADAYYGLLERVTGPDDHALPFRYAEALRTDDLGALGLAVKTAPTLGAALGRLVRYSLVLSDTLEYELVDHSWGGSLVLQGRPHHRRGAALANECALAAVTSVSRQIAGADLRPREVSFRHPAPADDRPHRDFFACPVTFDAPDNAVHLDEEQLARPTLLADEGLSTYLLAQLDELSARRSQRSLLLEVSSAVADALPDGQPSRSQVARRMGMSERTLQRRLAEHGATFQTVVTQARQDAAEALLRADAHSIVDVAFLTGFADQTAFTRAFKRWTGTTPAAYRQACA
jgi:AraC-like DNA-binding protein